MKIIHDSTLCLLHLLLLAELFVHSSSRPTSSPSLCGKFREMMPQVETLMTLPKTLHDLQTDDELSNFSGVEHELSSLPHIQHDARYFNSLQVNVSLSQLYVYVQSLRLHVDWLKTAKENVGLSWSAEGVHTRLPQLSNLVNETLHQISEEVPQPPSPSFPAISTTFEVVQFSVEISERLRAFCDWSKRVLRHLQRQSHCPKH